MIRIYVAAGFIPAAPEITFPSRSHVPLPLGEENTSIRQTDKNGEGVCSLLNQGVTTAKSQSFLT